MEQGYSVYDPRRMDAAHVPNHDNVEPSTARRAAALASDMNYLSHSDAIALLPEWDQWPEGVAMYHAARALHRKVIFVPEAAFMVNS